MTAIKYMGICCISLLLFLSCEKDNRALIASAASLNIINAVENSSALTANINNQLLYYKGQPSVFYGSSGTYTVTGGSTNLILRDQSDTTITLLNRTFNLPVNTVQSLFLTGNLENIESFLISDTLPYHGPQGHGTADSVVGIRFVNLSKGLSPVSVNIAGHANGSEVWGLDYKGITGFKNYTATADIDSYTFEFRDLASGDLLTSYTLTGVNDGINGNGDVNYVLFKNLTVALIGPAGSQTAVLIRNY